ncbi:MAG: ubiquitin-like protein Pup [bacterium]|nr:ubiquitin-like protein Pup [bacterium]MCY4164313.1 ubiquitin-like protein Pup [bacterium]MCY4257438.1 ubiquitin-like protein Pup [bacterium]
MSQRNQIKKSKPAQNPAEATQASVATTSSVDLKANLDELLDEIDEVLESNAEDFVKSYIQKGGQ